MHDVSLPWSRLAVLFAFTCLIAFAAGGAILFRRLATRLRQVDRRIHDLTRRLGQVESNLEQAGGETQVGKDTEVAGSGSWKSSPWSHTQASEKPPTGTAMITAEPGAAAARPTLISVPNLADDGRPVDPRLGSDLGQKHSEVWLLADAGVACEEIARRTGQPIGQVELIVALHRRLHPSRGPAEHVRSQ
jgi:hypothetical protein